MKVAVLGSGSRGNAVLLWGGSTRILVDAGFSARDLESRLASVGVAAESVRAIVLTHDHRDHTRGVGVFARKFRTPIYLTQKTLEACCSLFRGDEVLLPYRPGSSFRIGQLRVESFLTLHDAPDPVAVAVVDEGSGLKVGVATDLGRPTAQVRYALRDSHLLILEANHDEALLHQGPYPPAVRARIASSHGHLSNHAAARLAEELLHPGLLGVVLAHLSQECNRPELARAVVEEVLRRAGFRGFLRVAHQDRPMELLDLEALRNGDSPS